MPETIKLDATQTTDIEKAASLLLAGHLVARPTETVYGLAADASNEQAVRKVFEAKQRPVGHPLIVHVASPERIRYWVDRVPEAAEKLINTFWPGPLTLLLPKKSDVSDFITGGNSTTTPAEGHLVQSQRRASGESHTGRSFGPNEISNHSS